ncbi:uncharacterized protein EI90DRAFT_3054241 [Cantharellus anzutake]|uniref:uncharacterized protein n=1 Tax=Cantharellus anzutake TaxID=1750568 RepID=UPI0019079F81|nr:uncharacterized protein EI90DRAFT_3054241 [Cantharellus anzutake]KAF8332744.1 hypothetical protein EI90DRAFT_3054241 [Cantharellus anzutake]
MSLGTADILRKFSHLFLADVIVLPCDFIPPRSLPLSSILNDYRVDLHPPMVSVLLYERAETGKDGPPPCLFGRDKESNSLVFVQGESTGDDLELRTSMFWRFPNIALTTTYLDSHVYIVKQKCIELLAQRPSLESLKDDVIPWLASFSYRQSYIKKWGSSINFGTNPNELAIAYSTTTVSGKSRTSSQLALSGGALSRPILDAGASPSLTRVSSLSKVSQPQLETATTSPGLGKSHTSSPAPSGNYNDSPPSASAILDEATTSDFRVSARLHNLKDGFAARANTIGAYAELNRQALSAMASAAAHSEQPPKMAANPLHQGQISSDSLVASSARIGTKTSIKKSVVGPHCVIGKNVKLSGCTLIGYVEVKDGAKLENCIVSRNVVIAERATLKDCELAPGVVTQPEGESSIVKHTKPPPSPKEAAKPKAQIPAQMHEVAPARSESGPAPSTTQFNDDTVPEPAETNSSSAETQSLLPDGFSPPSNHLPPTYHAQSISLLTMFAFVLALIVSLKGERITAW